jgi:hypothetical protein
MSTESENTEGAAAAPAADIAVPDPHHHYSAGLVDGLEVEATARLRTVAGKLSTKATTIRGRLFGSLHYTLSDAEGVGDFEGVAVLVTAAPDSPKAVGSLVRVSVADIRLTAEALDAYAKRVARSLDGGGV